MNIIKLSALLIITIITASCNKHQKRGTTYPDGKPMEEFEVLETKEGSFIKDGSYKTWYPGAIPQVAGEYSQGKKVGNWKEWHPNGQMKSSMNFKDDILDGTYVGWYEGGQKSVEGKYASDHFVGPLTLWYQNGQVSATGNFDEKGKKVGAHVGWYENGIKKEEVIYKAGRRDGQYSFWSDKGKLKVQAMYHNDQLDGEYTEYFDNGNTYKKGSYKDGKQQGSWSIAYQLGRVVLQETYDHGVNVSLVGKWKLNNGSTIEYFRDGTAQLVGAGGIKANKNYYKIEGDQLMYGFRYYSLEKLTPTEYTISASSLFGKKESWTGSKIN